jgi:hypothetical protein
VIIGIDCIFLVTYPVYVLFRWDKRGPLNT